jgi:hypothetical protein
MSTKIIPFPQHSARTPALTGKVTFRSPFTLPGFDQPHRPGTFELRERRERLDVSFPAFVVGLSIILVDGGTTQSIDVTRDDLDAALMRDKALGQ